MTSRFTHIASASVLLLAALALGCQPNSDADATNSSAEDRLPKTYGAAVAKLETLSKSILNACSEGNVEAAHGPLHEIGHVIKAAPKLAVASNMSDEDAGAIQDASDALFAAFDKIDGSLHGRQAVGETLDFDALGEQINEALAVLSSKLEHASDEPVDVTVDTDDDHDHEDGDEHAEGEEEDEHGEGGDHDHDDDVGDDE